MLLVSKIVKQILYFCSYFFLFFLKFISWIFPFKFYLLPTERLGHLSQEPELLLRKKARLSKKITYILIVNPLNQIANEYFFQLIQSHFIIVKNYFFHYLVLVFKSKLISLNLYEDLNITRGFGVCYSDYKNVPRQISISETDLEKGKNLLHSLYGVDINHDRIICIFARDQGYLNKVLPENDWSYHNDRDIDVNVFIKSIEHLVNSGFKVFRIGKFALEKVQYEHPNFIDYPFSKGHSDFLDVFLIYISYLVIGTSAGITDLANVFERPYLCIGQIEPIVRCTLFIPKKIRKRITDVAKSDDYLHSNESKKYFYFPIEIKKLGLQYFNISKLGLEYLDNTPEEIYLAVNETLAAIENRAHFSENELNLIRRYNEEYWKDFVNSDKLNSPIAVSWLNKYKDLYFSN
ncbi:MAG: hypothetical protein ACD_45C00473G0006 [uncultured bacterium]|nr:MAG: hypothetical protein ACD_45C00473G0006 [uncultured bacterium]